MKNRKVRRLTWLWVLALLMVCMGACGKETPNNRETATINSGIATNPQTESKKETEPAIETEIETEVEVETETEPITEPETAPESETDLKIETDPETEPITEPETDPEPETEPETETESELEPEPPHVHTWGEWEVEVQPTCTKEGVQKRSCAECDDFETQSISAKGHTMDERETVEPSTCIKTGTERRGCTECDYVELWELAYSNHVMGNWSITLPATCTQFGTQQRTCSVCRQYVETESIEPKPHSYDLLTGKCSSCISVRYSTGLSFASNYDGTCYVNGIGSCTDTYVIVPPTSPTGEKVRSVNLASCKQIIHVALPEGATLLANYAFRGCVNLQSILIPKTMKELGGVRVYDDCNMLKTIYYNGTIREWKNIYLGCIWPSKTYTIHCSDGNLVNTYY